MKERTAVSAAQVGETWELQIEDMTATGQGVGRNGGLAVFVEGAVMGDRVRAVVTRVKKRYALAKMTALLEPSPARIPLFCENGQDCGGCPYGQLSYPGQLAMKEKQVRDKLTRLGGVTDPTVRSMLGMDVPFRYRNKAVMPIWGGGLVTRKGGVAENRGAPAIGFYQRRSHTVVDCRDCQLQTPPVMAAAEALRRFMVSDHITAYDPRWEKGLLRHLMVRTAFGTGEVMVVLGVNGKGIPAAEKLVQMLDDAIYALPVETEGPFAGVAWSLESVVVSSRRGTHGAPAGSVFGETDRVIAGRPTIRETLGGLRFDISPRSFYQVNPRQTVRLYAQAMAYADLHGGETVLDLYCGVGTIGLFAAKAMAAAAATSAAHGEGDVPPESADGVASRDGVAASGRVIGIECVSEAVLDANRNAVLNGVVSARYVCGRAEEVLPALLRGEGAAAEDPGLRVDHADVAFLDPPRTGCDAALLEAVAVASPARIVYISCDPATLARDVRLLGERGYAFREATPVDLFPWTGSTEVVALLVRRAQ